MSKITSKQAAKKRRHRRIRKKVIGTSVLPRLTVTRSLNHLTIQVIDDQEQKTVFSSSTMNKEFKKNCKTTGNVEAAKKLGEISGAQIIEKGIKKISFDRGGCLYHGRIKALADQLREAGLQF